MVLSAGGILCLALPVGAYFWFIHQYSVNVVYWDQWADMSLLDHWYGGALTFGDLWTAHGDHRMLFPNLIVLVLARSTHFNVTIEEYLSGAMLAAASGLFIATDRRRSVATPLIYYFPVTLILFSFVQFQNTLWGFQMAWYLVTLAFAMTLFLLDRPSLTGLVFAGAIIVAVVGSFSSLQGLLVWPVGLLVLYCRRRSRGLFLLWILCALITVALYFHDLDPREYSNQTYVFTHPLPSIKYFLFLIGSVVGVQLTNHPWLVILFGAVVLSIAVWVIVSHRGRDEPDHSLVGFALTSYGVLFAATVTQGRAWFALWAPSRYSTCGLLILAGCYLALLDRWPVRGARRRPSRLAAGSQRMGRFHAHGRTVIGAVLAVAVLLATVLGTGHGIVSAASWSNAQQVAADITVNINRASDALVQYGVVKGDPVHTRQSVETMKAHRLSLFDTGAVEHYGRQGLRPELTAVHTAIIIPANGATLTGTAGLDALASDISGVTKVDIRASAVNGGESVTLASGTPSSYGWIFHWDTSVMANGTYRLESVAFGPENREGKSTIITITIDNHS